MNKVDKYRSLLDGYEVGMYTDGEVVSAALGLLFQSDDREAFWKALTFDHRQVMRRLITGFDEAAEPFAINLDPIQVWREMSALKQWLGCRDI